MLRKIKSDKKMFADFSENQNSSSLKFGNLVKMTPNP